MKQKQIEFPCYWEAENFVNDELKKFNKALIQKMKKFMPKLSKKDRSFINEGVRTSNKTIRKIFGENAYVTLKFVKDSDVSVAVQISVRTLDSVFEFPWGSIFGTSYKGFESKLWIHGIGFPGTWMGIVHDVQGQVYTSAAKKKVEDSLKEFIALHGPEFIRLREAFLAVDTLQSIYLRVDNSTDMSFRSLRDAVNRLKTGKY